MLPYCITTRGTSFPVRRVLVVSDKWIYKHKFLSDESLERYKAQWVLRG
jgi:hypothetical protein